MVSDDDVGLGVKVRAREGGLRTGAIGILLVEAALDYTTLLIFEALGPVCGRGRAGSVLVHGVGLGSRGS